VNATGVITALVAGSATITVSDNEISGSTTLTMTSATLVSIGITPASASLANGTHQQFTATGVFSDNSTYNLTTAVTWTSSLPTVASADNTTGSSGLVTALAVGTTSIGASFLGVTAPGVPLTVTPATLVSIAITPASAILPLGLQQAFTATGTYTDNTTQIITDSVTWNSAFPVVASIGNTSGLQGQATGLSIGSSVISAASNGVTSAPVTLTVTSATLVSIAVNPASPSAALGLNQQFTATGTYSDRTTRILTATVIWHSSNVGVAPISNALGSVGLATTLQTGSSAITAMLGSVTSPAVTFTVTGATLVSLTVAPASYNIALGATKPFTATGTFTDNSTENLTSAVAWTSDNTAVVTLSNAPGTNGLATGATVGTAHITAAQGSVTSPAAAVNVAVFQESILYSFVGPNTDGAIPFAGLIQGGDGNLYGTTLTGGVTSPAFIGSGTVFELTPTGVETPLYSFTNSVPYAGSFLDGSNLFAGVIQGPPLMAARRPSARCSRSRRRALKRCCTPSRAAPMALTRTQA
jgi:trimeric autotransporter adhesin